MRAPIDRLSKKEILALHRWRCKHGHGGLSHYACWLAEHSIPEKIAFFDIESSGLVADFGIMLSWAMLDSNTGEILHDVITKEDFDSGKSDKRIVASCVNALKKYHRVVGHYSSGFDIPFIRSRALQWGIAFPHYGDILHTDVWAMARKLLKLQSNRQSNIDEFLRGTSEKTRRRQCDWLPALRGSKKALDFILDHNIRDVHDLAKNYRTLAPYWRKGNTSI